MIHGRTVRNHYQVGWKWTNGFNEDIYKTHSLHKTCYSSAGHRRPSNLLCNQCQSSFFVGTKHMKWASQFNIIFIIDSPLKCHFRLHFFYLCCYYLFHSNWSYFPVKYTNLKVQRGQTTLSRRFIQNHHFLTFAKKKYQTDWPTVMLTSITFHKTLFFTMNFI